MSLLLDALKRAEQEKLTRQSDRPPEPAPRTPSAAQPAAAVLELQPIGGAAPAASAAPRADAQTAQTVFKAKAGAPAKPDRRILWAAAGAIVLVVLAAGAYFWHSLNTLAPRRQAIGALRPAPITAAPASAGQPGGPAAASAAPSSAAATAPVPKASTLPASDAQVAEPPRESAPIDELLKQPQPAAEPAVTLARDAEPPRPRVAPDVDAGYRALVEGDLAAAERHYAAGVEADPASVDAQLGLATVEARSGNVGGAAAAYRRVLELDPRNPTALAGLAALADNAPPEALESALNADIAQHPDSAALQLTLGNLYASHRRWTEAQAAYFEAERLQPENADVAYNLAVSLDHLGQRRAAAEFYRRALRLHANRGAQFDAAAASRRLAQLTR